MADVTLKFLAEQLRRLLDAQARLYDEMLVTGARVGYLDASLERIQAAITMLTVEIRSSRNELARMDPCKSAP